MTDEISDAVTDAKEAPGPATPSLDEKKVDPTTQQNGSDYLQEKGTVMTPEGLLGRFKELQEENDPVNAILVTEVQEIKGYIDSLHKAATFGLVILAVAAFGAAYIIHQSRKDSE